MNYAITDEILQGVSQSLGDVFDSHALIFAVMRQYPREYTTDLYQFVASPDPFLSLHASIGQRLLHLGTLTPARRVTSRNIRGEENENQEWRRK